MRKVVITTNRIMGEGITITGDCNQKERVCAKVKWYLCPGWVVAAPPCKYLDQEFSSFETLGNSTSAPEIVINCNKEVK